MNSIELLNPYSVRLEKDPFIRVENKPVHTNGDFRIYKYTEKYFIHTFKNIVIAERCAVNKDLLTNVSGSTTEANETKMYMDYVRPLEAMQQGVEAAKKLNFVIQ